MYTTGNWKWKPGNISCWFCKNCVNNLGFLSKKIRLVLLCRLFFSRFFYSIFVVSCIYVIDKCLELSLFKTSFNLSWNFWGMSDLDGVLWNFLFCASFLFYYFFICKLLFSYYWLVLYQILSIICIFFCHNLSWRQLGYTFKQLFYFYAGRNKQKKINKWDSVGNLAVSKTEKNWRSAKGSNFLLMHC